MHLTLIEILGLAFVIAMTLLALTAVVLTRGKHQRDRAAIEAAIPMIADGNESARLKIARLNLFWFERSRKKADVALLIRYKQSLRSHRNLWYIGVVRNDLAQIDQATDSDVRIKLLSNLLAASLSGDANGETYSALRRLGTDEDEIAARLQVLFETRRDELVQLAEHDLTAFTTLRKLFSTLPRNTGGRRLWRTAPNWDAMRPANWNMLVARYVVMPRLDDFDVKLRLCGLKEAEARDMVTEVLLEGATATTDSVYLRCKLYLVETRNSPKSGSVKNMLGPVRLAQLEDLVLAYEQAHNFYSIH